ncbi:MAG: WYL domain-containing protein [Myxococcales bacterium]|nr:WYL domain-containing protein [Myxococcales bacterium]
MTRLVERRSVSQAELARDAGVDSEVIKARLEELREAGVPLSHRREGRGNVWTVAKHWFPSGVVFDRDEASKLLVLLLRLRRSTDRDAFLERIVSATIGAKQIPRITESARAIDGTPGDVDDAEEHRTNVQRAIMDRQAISVRYQKAGDDEPEWRTVSPQTVVNAEKPYAVVLDHRSGELKHFRFNRMKRVLREQSVSYREADAKLVESKVKRSVHGYDGAPLETISFVIHDSVWGRAKDNLPFTPTTLEKTDGGWRIVVETTGRPVIVRFLLAYGTHVTIETPSVRNEVVAHAREAAAWHAREPQPKSQLDERRQQQQRTDKRNAGVPSVLGQG